MKTCPICQTKFQEEILFCPKDGERLVQFVVPQGEKLDPLIGYVIDNKYHIERKIAEGGMSSVYLASHLQLEIPVAVKVMHARLVSDDKAIRRFRREAQSAMRIRHTNAITVLDFGVTDQVVYLIMEYLQGCTLKEKLKETPLLPLEEIYSIFLQVCSAVKVAHRRGIIHRDLKPENIFIQNDAGTEVVKVLDFGIAKLQFSEGGAMEESLTQAGSTLGSPHYMAPEQLADNEIIDLRADIYSLGVILFELLAGETLFKGPSATSIAYKHLTEKPRSILSLRPELPSQLDDVVQRALEKEASARYEDVNVFLEDLSDAFACAGVYEQRLFDTAARHRLSDSGTRRIKTSPLEITSTQETAVPTQETVVPTQETVASVVVDDEDSSSLLRLHTKPEWPQIKIPLSLKDLPVYYELEGLFLPEFFGALAVDKVTGITWFSYGANIKGLVWQNGEIVFAVSNDQTERLGERLVRQGRISRQQYNKALQQQSDQESSNILDTLINLQFLPEQSAASLLTAHVYSISHSIIDWEEGGYAFDASALNQTFKTSLSVGELILESVRSLIDIERIRAFLGPEDETWLAVTDPHQQTNIMLRSDELLILRQLETGRKISQVLQSIDLPEEQVLRTLAALLSLKTISRVDGSKLVQPVTQEKEPEPASVQAKPAVSVENISLFFYELENMFAQISRAGNDYYARLGIGPQASLQEITTTFQQLKERFDPSGHKLLIEQMPSLKVQIETIYQSIQEAYDKLSSSPERIKPPLEQPKRFIAQPLQKGIAPPPMAQKLPNPVISKAQTPITPSKPVSPTLRTTPPPTQPIKVTTPISNVPNANVVANPISKSSPIPSNLSSIKPSSSNLSSQENVTPKPMEDADSPSLPPSLQNFNNPSNLRKPDDWYLYGLDLMDKGDNERAARAFRQAISLRPKDAEFHAALARTLDKLHNFNEHSVKEFEEAVSLQPKNPDYKVEIGTFYLKHNRIELARKYIEEALAIKPEHKGALKAKKKLDELG
jgi:serine/threonine protein kinase/tetratricopeptide (TPR) repeat protein